MSKKRPIIVFTKRFRNDDYEILFNENSGFEILRGVNGKADPFYLELPSLLDIGVMGSCKNKCNFCYQGNVKEPNMKLEDFKSIIDQVSHHVNQVALGGRGDPNKHENFEEILKYCRNNKVVPNYTTSGIDLTDEEVEVSKLCGAVAVSQIFLEHKIKIKVRRKIDERSELRTPSFVYQALNKLINSNIKTNIHFIYSKLSHNLAIDILNGKDIWQGKVDINKLDAVIFLLFKPQGSGKNLDWMPTDSQLKEFSGLIFKPKSKFMVGVDSCLVNHMLKYEQPDKLQSMAIDTCEGTRQSGYITPDMNMMPCSFADRSRFSVKITDKQNIYDIWNKSFTFKRFRNHLYKNPMKCPLF
jgi:organic radical activating enzyme